MEKYIESKFVDLTINDEHRLISFLADLKEVYIKHNMSISHEDSHGSMIVEDYDEDNLEWVKECTFLAYEDDYTNA